MLCSKVSLPAGSSPEEVKKLRHAYQVSVTVITRYLVYHHFFC